MRTEGVLFFLGFSILLYCLLAGADFGAGILELFRGRSLRDEQRELVSHAIAPVWEANHVWLILAVGLFIQWISAGLQHSRHPFSYSADAALAGRDPEGLRFHLSSLRCGS